MNVTTMNETLLYFKEIVDIYMPEYFKSMEYTPWIFSLLGSALIGASGILPLLLIPSVSSEDSKNKELNDRK